MSEDTASKTQNIQNIVMYMCTATTYVNAVFQHNVEYVNVLKITNNVYLH